MPLTLEDCRRFYSEEIRFAEFGNVNSPAVLEAFARVPREKFLGPPPWQIPRIDAQRQPTYIPVSDPRDLYHNVAVSLDAPKGLNNGQPSALAYWIDALDLKPDERVFHLGCGVGYYTAIIAEVVGSGGSVVASEVHAELGARATANLAEYANVKVVISDAEVPPFDPGECDAIFINAGVTHPLPLWLDRLREGGRLVLPLTMSTNPVIGTGVMVKIVLARGCLSAGVVSTVVIYSAVGLRDASLEPAIQAAIKTESFARMKSVRRDVHDPVDTCVLHTPGACLSSADLTGSNS